MCLAVEDVGGFLEFGLPGGAPFFYIRVILGFYRGCIAVDGKENGNYYSDFRI